jgi:hypothetical protein
MLGFTVLLLWNMQEKGTYFTKINIIVDNYFGL